MMLAEINTLETKWLAVETTTAHQMLQGAKAFYQTQAGELACLI